MNAEQGTIKSASSEALAASASLSDKDLQKYGKNLKELEELLALEEEYQKAATDLSETKTQLTRIESEIQREREQEAAKEQKIQELWEQAKQKEDAGLLEQALDVYLEIVEWNPRHARSIAHIQNIKKQLHQREVDRLAEEQRSKQMRENFGKRLQEGQRWFSRNEWAKALEEFREAALLDSQHAESRQWIASCELKIREAEEKLLREAAEKSEKKRQRDDWALEAAEKLRREDYEGALGAYEKALRVHPEDAEILEQITLISLRLSELKAESAQKRETVETLKKKITALDLDALEALGAGDFTKALSYWGELVLLDPSRADLLDRVRQEQERRLRRNEEDKKMREACERSAREFYAEGVKAMSCLSLEAAIEKFSSVLNLIPDHAEALAKLSELALKKTQRAEEQKIRNEEELRKVENSKREEKTHALERLVFQAETCMADKDFEKAVLFWEKALDTEPASAEAKEGFAKAKRQFREKESARRSLQDLEARLERERKNLSDREKEFQEGLAFFKGGFWEQAEKRFESLRQPMRATRDGGEVHG